MAANLNVLKVLKKIAFYPNRFFFSQKFIWRYIESDKEIKMFMIWVLKEGKQRQRLPLSPAVSVFDEKLYFCKSAQTTLTCSLVMLARLVAAAPFISTN